MRPPRAPELARVVLMLGLASARPLLPDEAVPVPVHLPGATYGNVTALGDHPEALSGAGLSRRQAVGSFWKLQSITLVPTLVGFDVAPLAARQAVEYAYHHKGLTQRHHYHYFTILYSLPYTENKQRLYPMLYEAPGSCPQMTWQLPANDHHGLHLSWR